MKCRLWQQLEKELVKSGKKWSKQSNYPSNSSVFNAGCMISMHTKTAWSFLITDFPSHIIPAILPSGFYTVIYIFDRKSSNITPQIYRLWSFIYTVYIFQLLRLSTEYLWTSTFVDNQKSTLKAYVFEKSTKPSLLLNTSILFLENVYNK